MDDTVTMAFRVPRAIRDRAIKISQQQGYPNPSEMCRTMMTEVVSGLRPLPNRSEACKQQEIAPLRDNTRPWQSFARSEACSACPYREHHRMPVIDRETALPNVPSSGGDPVAKMIDELFEDGKMPQSKGKSSQEG